LNALLAPHGSMPMQRDHFWDLPLYFDAGITPIAISVPPFHLWEPPPLEGAVPMHGSDFGLFQMAEVLGMKQVIFVKDEDGLYDSDPKKNKAAKRFDTVSYDRVLADNLKVMDASAVALCRDNGIPIVVFSIREKGNLARVLGGGGVQTIVQGEA
jgi:hypothetical protein